MGRDGITHWHSIAFAKIICSLSDHRRGVSRTLMSDADHGTSCGTMTMGWSLSRKQEKEQDLGQEPISHNAMCVTPASIIGHVRA